MLDIDVVDSAIRGAVHRSHSMIPTASLAVSPTVVGRVSKKKPACRCVFPWLNRAPIGRAGYGVRIGNSSLRQVENEY